MNDLNWVYATCFETVFKAIQVNAQTGEYNILKRPHDEMHLNIPKSGSIEAYVKAIGNSGLVYPADFSDFHFHFNPVYIRRSIRYGQYHQVHTFRRKMRNHYTWVTFELIIPSSYSEQNPNVLYIWKLADNDSRGLEDSMRMLSSVYRKIIRINLSDDLHQELKVDYESDKADHGMSVKMSEWFRKFAENGYVYKDDVKSFMEFTSIHRIRMHFRHSKESTELIYRRKEEDGKFRWASMELIPSVEYTPENQIVILYIRDVHDIYSLEQKRKKEIEYYQSRDILTGFLNRASYQEACKNYFGLPRKKTVAVIYADMNGLKLINDTQGDEAGDAYIRRFTDVFGKYFDTDRCYRISGDEFLVIIQGITKKEAGAKFRAFRDIMQMECDQTAAIGYAWINRSGTLEEVVKSAESAMYLDKHEYYRFHSRYAF